MRLPHSYWMLAAATVFVLATASELVYRAVTIGPEWLALVAGLYLFAFLGGAAATVLRVPRDQL